MNYKIFNSILQRLPWILIVFIGIVYIFCTYCIIPLGDDLGFINSFRSQNDCWYALPRAIYRHWIWNNARFADILGFWEKPIWLKAVCNGAMVALFFYLCVKASHMSKPKSSFPATILIFLLVTVMRWDAIWMEYMTFYNYIWSSAFILLAVNVITSRAKKSNVLLDILLVPFSFIAGAMHEACGFPAALGMATMCVTTPLYKNSPTLRRLSVIALICGGIYTLTSPASFHRVGTMMQPENPLIMTLDSALFPIVLIICIPLLYIYKKDLFFSLIHSKWIFFATASIISLAFMYLSRFGGRTGWFAQMYALIALFILLSKSDLKINRKATVIMSIVIGIVLMFHLSAMAVYQFRLNMETGEVISLYKNAEDGIVFYDYTQDTELPWYLMHKNHGVPDDDDTYYRYRMKIHYSNGKQLAILPTAFYPIPDSIPEPVIHKGYILSEKLIWDTYGDTIVDQFPRTFSRINGEEYVVNDFQYKNRKLYLLSKVDRDRGEK